ncbi:MAG: CHAT domain-containing protein, partial [Pseudomonadota bacterium]
MEGVQFQINGESNQDNAVDSATVRVTRRLPGTGGTLNSVRISVEPIAIAGTHPSLEKGRELFQRLADHDTLERALLSLSTGINDAQPLYLNISDETGTASRLPWETLFFEDDFLALRTQRSIARVTDSREKSLIHPTLSSSIRIMSVISMMGSPGEDEWRAVQDAITATRADQLANRPGLQPEHLLLVGEQDLYQTAQSESAQDASLQAEMIPRNSAALIDRIKAYEPHILHLYCHGDSRPRLLFGTNVDWLQGTSSEGSLRLRADEVAQAARDAGTWVVVLNACLSGAAADDGPSAVEELVANGVPVAVGHRVYIQPSFATQLTEALYPDLFALLADTIERGRSDGSTQEIEWAQLLWRARRNSA